MRVGVASTVLRNLDVDIERCRAGKSLLSWIPILPQTGRRPHPWVVLEEEENKDSKTPALKTFGRDLTELARNGEMDPVIGRKDEIRRVIQILCRRTKNNPVLIGEAGVGKTAIARGLAQEISGGLVLKFYLISEL